MVIDAASDVRSKKVAVEVSKNYGISDILLGPNKEDMTSVKIFTIATEGEKQTHPSLIFPMTLEKSEPDALIACGNQLLVAATVGMKE